MTPVCLVTHFCIPRNVDRTWESMISGWETRITIFRETGQVRVKERIKVGQTGGPDSHGGPNRGPASKDCHKWCGTLSTDGYPARERSRGAATRHLLLYAGGKSSILYHTHLLTSPPVTHFNPRITEQILLFLCLDT